MKCKICRDDVPSEAIETHHLVPKRHGGDDSDENLVDLCANCHRVLERLYTDAVWDRWNMKKTRERLDVLEDKVQEWRDRIYSCESPEDELREEKMDLIENHGGVAIDYWQDVDTQDAGCPACGCRLNVFSDKKGMCPECNKSWYNFEWVEHDHNVSFGELKEDVFRG